MADEIAKPAAKAKTLRVTILHDVWDDKGERIATNIPVTDDYGNPVYEKDEQGRPKALKTKLTTVDLPIDLAKKLLAEKKAERADPLPE